MGLSLCSSAMKAGVSAQQRAENSSHNTELAPPDPPPPPAKDGGGWHHTAVVWPTDRPAVRSSWGCTEHDARCGPRPALTGARGQYAAWGALCRSPPPFSAGDRHRLFGPTMGSRRAELLVNVVFSNHKHAAAHPAIFPPLVRGRVVRWRSTLLTHVQRGR